jgi:hypothetical protein
MKAWNRIVSGIDRTPTRRGCRSVAIRPDVEGLEQRLVMDGSTPEVLFQFPYAYLQRNNGLGGLGGFIAETVRLSDSPDQLYPTFNETGALTLDQDLGNGRATGTALLSISAGDGTLRVTQDSTVTHEHFGGNRGLFSHVFQARMAALIYVLGGPDTPYRIDVTGSATFQQGSQDTVGT